MMFTDQLTKMTKQIRDEILELKLNSSLKTLGLKKPHQGRCR